MQGTSVGPWNYLHLVEILDPVEEGEVSRSVPEVSQGSWDTSPSPNVGIYDIKHI